MQVRIVDHAPRATHYARLTLPARPTLANTPVAASATISEDRPYDMNGKVTPVAGITARLTPICSTTLSPTITLIPVASSWPNGSCALRAMRKPSQTNVLNSSAIASTPRKPHSSPIVEKMKAEYAYGRYPSFCCPCPNPTPSSCPAPMPVSDCCTWDDASVGAPGFKNVS